MWSWRAAKAIAVQTSCSGPGLSSLALRRALVEGQAPQGEFCCLLVSLGLCTRKPCCGTDCLCHKSTKESSRLFPLSSSKMGMMKTLSMNSHCIYAEVYLHAILSSTPSAEGCGDPGRREDTRKHWQYIRHNPCDSLPSSILNSFPSKRGEKKKKQQKASLLLGSLFQNLSPLMVGNLLITSLKLPVARWHPSVPVPVLPLVEAVALPPWHLPPVFFLSWCIYRISLSLALCQTKLFMEGRFI